MNRSVTLTLPGYRVLLLLMALTAGTATPVEAACDPIVSGGCVSSCNSTCYGLNGTTRDMAYDGSISTYFYSACDNWQHIVIDLNCVTNFYGLRRYMSRYGGGTGGNRGPQGEGVSYSLDGITYIPLTASTSTGWQIYVSYATGAWHSVSYAWSAWLLLKTPVEARYVKYSWDANNDYLNEIEIDYTVASKALTVSKAGAGSGIVSSNPAGIDCGSDCTEAYPVGTSVTLSASAAEGSEFAGWSNGTGSAMNCSGIEPCTFTSSEDSVITASFEARQLFNISGIVTSGRLPVSGVTLSLVGDAVSETFTTGVTGTYSFSVRNGAYTITPSKILHAFSPPSRTETVNGHDVAEADFSAAQEKTSVLIRLPAASATKPEGKAFRMISIPVLPEGDSDLFDTLSIFFGGSYDPQTWKLYKTQGARFVEVTGHGQDTIDYCKGWWIISSAKKKIIVSGVTETDDFQCQTTSGYKMISCPYSFTSLSWESIFKDPANSALKLGSKLFWWDGSGEYVTSETLDPGRAYWAWSRSAGALRIVRSYAPFRAEPHWEPSTQDEVDGTSTELADVSEYASTATQPPPPLSPASAIQIVLPKEGVQLKAGKYYLIKWQSIGISPQGYSSRVIIAYSIDGGKTYLAVTPDANSSGSFKWKVPAKASTRCLIKVISKLYAGVSATSAMFTIK